MYFGDEVELPSPRMEVLRGGLGLPRLRLGKRGKLHPLAQTAVASAFSNNNRFDVIRNLSCAKEIKVTKVVF